MMGRFIDIFTGAPGRVHDSRVLRVSPFFGTWWESMGQHKLLGDTAYISQTYPVIITLKRDNGKLIPEEQQMNVCSSCVAEWWLNASSAGGEGCETVT